MNNLLWWLCVIAAVFIAVLADYVSTIWASDVRNIKPLLIIIILGPLVFISFGLVTTKSGLAIASGIVNSLLVVSSISVGLFFLNEWTKLSLMQYVGLLFSVVGIILMTVFTKH